MISAAADLFRVNMSSCGSARGEFKAVRRRPRGRVNIFDNIASAARGGGRREEETSDFRSYVLRSQIRRATTPPRTSMNRAILFAAQIRRLFPPARPDGAKLPARTRTPSRPLRGLVKLNRCVRSLKLYVVADTHAVSATPPGIYERASTRGSASASETRRGGPRAPRFLD